MSSDRQRLVDQLVRHEGIRLKSYVDTTGHLTIGVGRNLTDKGISHAEAMLLLDNDIDEAITDLAGFPWFVSLDPVRQRVIIDLRFNLGPTRFRKFRRLIAALHDQDYVKAAGSLQASLWYRQVGSRAVRLTAMMLTGAEAA